VNVYVTLTFYRHGNTKQTSFHICENKPHGPKERDRKMIIINLEKLTEYY
jgi:hypothetical protein